MSNIRSAIKFKDEDLLCKNHCGFYGNPLWCYYCSVCYRNVYLKNPQNIINTPIVTTLKKSEGSRNVAMITTSNKTKNIIKSNKDFHRNRDDSDCIDAKENFEYFLSTLNKNVAVDIMKLVKIHLESLVSAKYTKIEEYSVLVQKFYERLIERFNNHAIYKGIAVHVTEEFLEEIERYLSIEIYEWAFKSNFSNDEIKDLELQKRIRSLNWITPDILEAAIDEESVNEKVHFDNAITAMIEMNTKVCPQDKLDCIVRCCKAVFEAINAHNMNVSHGCGSNSRLVNADNFLPSLILVLIRANPTLLHSNIQFIMRFSRPSLTNSGENGYMFTNMCIAIEFINTLDHKALNMTEQQFSDAMTGIKLTKPLSDLENGKASASKIDATFTALRILDNNENMLQKLSEKEEVLRVNLIQLQEETSACEPSLNSKLESNKEHISVDLCLDHNIDLDDTLTVHHKSRPSWELIDSTIESSLPAPLLPKKSDAPIDKENWDFFLQ